MKLKKNSKKHVYRKQPDADQLRQQMDNAVRLHLAGRLMDAVAIYERVLALNPDHADALHLSGVAAHQTGHHEKAAGLIQKAIAISPHVAMFYYNLGAACHALGNSMEAIACYKKALSLKPDYAEAHSNMGNSYLNLGRIEEAIACHQQAIRLKPEFADAYNNLGTAFSRARRSKEALACFHKTLALNPSCFEVLHNIGNLHKDENRLSEAIIWYQKALAVNPAHPEVNNNIGSVLQSQGRIQEALSFYDIAIKQKPDFAAAHSNRLFALNNQHQENKDFLFHQHLAWDHQHGSGKVSPADGYPFIRDSIEKIHIGYVSPDFREHSVACFIEPILKAHDRNRFSVTCYSDVPYPDEVTSRLKRLGWEWRDTSGIHDDALFDQIQADGIQVLVDLAGHTAGNRLTLFARKPAPVQVSYIGYPNTTGLRAMDYRITDPVADPPGWTDHLHTEKLIRVPEGFLCYQPLPDVPEVSDLPAIINSGITFASFNNRAKITDQVIHVWSDILNLIPGARLILKSMALGDIKTRLMLAKQFEDCRVDIGRIEMQGFVTRNNHLGMYRHVDVALDTFPYNGTTTTCEALWMGVPVISLQGEAHVGRVGASLLTRVGMDAFIAGSVDEYIQKAVFWSRNLAMLRSIRQSMRENMRASPLMDAGSLARSLERVYETIWADWQKEQSEKPATLSIN